MIGPRSFWIVEWKLASGEWVTNGAVFYTRRGCRQLIEALEGDPYRVVRYGRVKPKSRKR